MEVKCNPLIAQTCPHKVIVEPIENNERSVIVRGMCEGQLFRLVCQIFQVRTGGWRLVRIRGYVGTNNNINMSPVNFEGYEAAWTIMERNYNEVD
jgi:hypothetical protein